MTGLVWAPRDNGQNETINEERDREVIELAELWNGVSEVNRVWLAPSPKRLSYSVTTTHPNSDGRHTECENRVWIDGQKVRWEMDVKAPINEEPLSSYALVARDGKETYLKGPESIRNQTRQARARGIHALKQGITWQTAMHAVYVTGLPDGSRIVERYKNAHSDIVVVEVNLGKQRSDVGLGLYHGWKGHASCRIDRARVHLNVTEKVPVREEYVDRGFKIEYVGQFLDFGEQKAPSTIRHIGQNQLVAGDWVLQAQFQDVDGNWMLEKASNIQGNIVIVNYVVRNASTKEIDATVFAVPSP